MTSVPTTSVPTTSAPTTSTSATSAPTTRSPTSSPTHVPSKSPTFKPTLTPTQSPTKDPTRTNHPTRLPSDAPTNSPTQAPSELPTNHPTSVPSESPTISCNFMKSSANTSTRQCEIKDSRSSFTINGIYTSCSKITYPISLMFCKFSKVRSECPLKCSCKNFSSLELCEDDDSFSADFKTCHNFNEGDCECEVGDGTLIQDHCPKKVQCVQQRHE